MTEKLRDVTNLGENEHRKFEKKVTNDDSLRHYEDLFQLLKHLLGDV